MPTAPSSTDAPALATTPPGLAPLTIAPAGVVGLTRFIAFGDSITFGSTSAFDQGLFYAAANGGYPERLQALLTSRHAPQQFAVFNEGSPGEFAISALMRFRTALTNRRPQAVLLLEGINDLSNGISVSQTVNGLRQMLDAAAAAGVPVVVATMYQTYEVVGPDQVLRDNAASVVPAFNAGVRQLVTGRPNVYLVDLDPLMRNRAFVGADGLHLTEAGFQTLTTAFLTVVESGFPVRGSFQ